jgi:hypothetical protein
MHATRRDRKGGVSFACHPWPNTYFTWAMMASFGAAMVSFGVFELLADAWALAAFGLAIGLALPVIGLLIRDELKLDGSAIIRPSGRATRRIAFEELMSFEAGDRGRLTIAHRGQSWYGRREVVRRERARLLDAHGFLQEAFAQIERRRGAEFVTEIRARSGD